MVSLVSITKVEKIGPTFVAPRMPSLKVRHIVDVSLDDNPEVLWVVMEANLFLGECARHGIG
jgi:hypothetical protein